MSTCILLHGFTGSPAEVEPLARELERRGYRTLCPVLAGHCATKREMEQVTAYEWVHCVELILQKELAASQSIHLIGFSMGGLIATQLAQKYDVLSLTLLSTPIYYTNPKQLFKRLAEAIKSKAQSGNMYSDFRSYLSKVSDTPLRSVAHFRRLVQTTKPTFANVKVPALIFQGMLDDLAEPRSATYIYENIGSVVKELRWFEHSPHLLCLGDEKEDVARAVGDFVDMHDLDRGRDV